MDEKGSGNAEKERERELGNLRDRGQGYKGLIKIRNPKRGFIKSESR